MVKLLWLLSSQHEKKVNLKKKKKVNLKKKIEMKTISWKQPWFFLAFHLEREDASKSLVDFLTYKNIVIHHFITFYKFHCFSVSYSSKCSISWTLLRLCVITMCSSSSSYFTKDFPHTYCNTAKICRGKQQLKFHCKFSQISQQTMPMFMLYLYLLSLK